MSDGAVEDTQTPAARIPTHNTHSEGSYREGTHAESKLEQHLSGGEDIKDSPARTPTQHTQHTHLNSTHEESTDAESKLEQYLSGAEGTKDSVAKSPRTPPGVGVRTSVVQMEGSCV